MNDLDFELTLTDDDCLDRSIYEDFFELCWENLPSDSSQIKILQFLKDINKAGQDLKRNVNKFSDSKINYIDRHHEQEELGHNDESDCETHKP